MGANQGVSGIFAGVIGRELDREIRVLVVDDVSTNRAALSSLLAGDNVIIDEAENGAQALANVISNDYDLVILDVVMPDLDGLSVLERIRNSYSESDLPVLILTVKDEIADIIRGLQLGANDYVTRPIDFSVLVERIRRLVQYKLKHDAIRVSQVDLTSQIEESKNELIETNRALRAQVAEREFAEVRARENEAKYRALYDDMPAICLTIDDKEQIVSANKYCESSLGLTSDAVVGARFFDLFRPEDYDTVNSAIKKARTGKSTIAHWDGVLIGNNENMIHARCSSRIVSSKSGDFLHVVCADKSRTKFLEQEITRLRSHDVQTGLVNREELERHISRALNDSEVHGKNYVLCYVDIGAIRSIQETYGFSVTNEVIAQISALISGLLRKDDAFARIDTERFALIFADCDIASANILAKRMRNSINEHTFSSKKSSFYISCNVGLTAITKQIGDVFDIMSAADSAVSAASKNDRVVTHDTEIKIREKDLSEYELVTKLKGAADNGRFHLYAQALAPITKELKAPNFFATNKYDLMYLIDPRVVIDENTQLDGQKYRRLIEKYSINEHFDQAALSRIFNWLVSHRPICGKWKHILIYISPKPELVDWIAAELSRLNLEPSWFCFMLNASTKSIENISRCCTRIKEMGALVGVDPFSDICSQLIELRSKIIDFIVLDQATIQNIDNADLDFVTAEYTNRLAKTVATHTIAPAVDHRFIFEKLLKTQVDFGFGLFFHEPRPIDVVYVGS